MAVSGSLRGDVSMQLVQTVSAKAEEEVSASAQYSVQVQRLTGFLGDGKLNSHSGEVPKK